MRLQFAGFLTFRFELIRMSTWAVSGYERAGLREMVSVKGSNLAIDETYLQGVSTRRVAKVMIGICGGNGDSATYIGQCRAQLDTLFEKQPLTYKGLHR